MDAPCLLARLNDEASSDLALVRETQGNGAANREQVGFSPTLLKKDRLILKQGDTGEYLASQTRLTWLEPLGYVPLLANTGFDGTGISGGGLVPRQRRHEDPTLNSVALLRELGLAVAEPRREIETYEKVKTDFGEIKIERKYSSFKSYPEPASYDVALIRSMLKLGGLGKNSGSHFEALGHARNKTGVEYINRWASKFSRHGIESTEAERALIGRIYTSLRPIPHEVSLLVEDFPLLYLPGGMDQLYANLRSGDDKLITDAISGILSVAVRQTPEQNDSHADAYLEVMEDQRFSRSMVRIAGRFSFDPVPVLRRYLDDVRKDAAGPSLSVLKAACWADPRWSDQLALFVMDVVRGMPANLRDSDRNKIVSLALNTLNVQRQQMAWSDLKSELGPEIFTKANPASFGQGQC